MADYQSGRKLIDYISSFNLGMNGGLRPSLLPRNQLFFASNLTVRGGLATHRPPFSKAHLTFAWSSPLVQASVEGGLVQGVCFYKPDSGPQCIMASISGHLYRFQISGDTVSIDDVSVAGDFNSPTATQAWLWQSDKWVIVQDGISLPIFFDGTSSRRSYGPSVELIDGVPAGTVPAIGDTVTVDTTPDVYAGPYDVPVLFNGEYYQPIINASGYKVTLTTVYDTSAAAHPIGSEVVIQPSVAGYMTAQRAQSYNVTTIVAGGISASIPLSTPYTGAIDSLVQISGNATDGTYTFANGTTILWRVTGIAGNNITVTNQNTLYTGPRAIVGYFYPSGTVVTVYGTTSPNVSLGVTSAIVPIGPAGTTVDLYLSKAYTGAAGQIVFINGGQYSIQVAADAPAVPTNLVMINLSDTEGATYPVLPSPSLPVLSVPEIPAGRMGAYVMGQNWFSSVDGLAFGVSDLSRGPSGTVANDYRDSVLKTVDLTFGGGYFAIPASGSYITAIIGVPKLDESLGQGPVQIGTTLGVFTAQAPFDYLDPNALTTPLLPQVLMGYGPLGQDSTVLVNSDTHFRFTDGIASLIQARREFVTWGNTSISEEVNERILSNDNEELLPFGTAANFDNRKLDSVSPQASNAGVIHAGMTVINLDPVSSLRGKEPSVYDGLWTGLNLIKLVGGKFDGVSRQFAFGYNVDTLKVELYEIFTTASGERFDNGYIPIRWGFETASLFNADIKPPNELMRLEAGEISLDNVLGRVRIQAWYKFDEGCWIPWHDCYICAAVSGGPQSFPKIGFPQPSDTHCSMPGAVNAREGYMPQVKLQITGSCRFVRGRFKGVTVATPEFTQPTCGDNECVAVTCPEMTPDLEVYSLQTNIIFNSNPITINVPCPDGWTCPTNFSVTYPPGTFVLPQPDEDGVYTAQGCQSLITTTSQEDLLQQLAQQQSECDAVTNPPPGWEPPETPPPVNPPGPLFALRALSEVQHCGATEYTGTIETTSGIQANVNFELIGGALPSGLSLSQAGMTATISGVPAAFGYFTFTIRATHSLGMVAVRQYNLWLGNIETTSLPDASEGEPYSQVLAGQPTGFWSISAGDLPPGLSLASDGTISGTPEEDGTYTFTVRLADAEGSATYCEQQLSILVEPLFELTWVEVVEINNGTAISSWAADGNNYGLSGSAPDTPGSAALLQIKGTMNHVGTGFVIPCRVNHSVSAANGQLPNGSNFVQVHINSVLVLSKGGADGTNVEGSYQWPFNLPATNALVEVTIQIDVRQQNLTTSALACSGTVEFDP